MKVEWTKCALHQLVKIDTRYQKTIKDKIGMLTDFPAVNLDIRKLAGMEFKYRITIGPYRVIFELDKAPKIIEIQEILRRTSKTY
ncbi:type II toxin-antitoxin system RelE/ParE family toxin (plasmid) [Leclercia adecarboxylata]|uniref:type II toxin-antitoxin system RelE family toxin n=1 Tax=Leclercia adecarboxylata TaxID=83655 RepID=UPI00111830AA|nr:type II toxin-antitoxin system RelE/ParE family toxin [Leclercia adecarboxylata]QCZ30181.1 type II toxin-antitoxin system RelE/ParE family toxin [Leclercia adecarboxylata]QFH68062.1 type II toxin-antitoxin system RelE/ParE family toxin [Leclercia adecarboxylata]